MNRVILDHREDYVGVLEYCDSIYADLADADIAEEEKLRWAEEAFVDFHTRAFLRAYREYNENLHKELIEMGVVSGPFPPALPGIYDLSIEAIRASNPWDATLRSGVLEMARRREAT